MQSRNVLLLFCASSLLFACDEEPSTTFREFGVQQSMIVNGTRDPTITNLSAGQEMAIGFIGTSSGTPFCTATLIDRDTAVTAAHCVEDTYAIEDMRFGMGDPGNPDALIPVHSAPYDSDADVALLFLQQDAVDLVPTADPLPFLRTEPSSSLVGTTVEAAGYGETNTNEDGKFYVQVELQEIQADWLVVNGWGQQGICFGDSGGPLLIEVDGGEPVIAGVESHGDSSCVDQDFESRLDKAADWIDTQMGNFDPNSAPQTGTQGGGEICVPIGWQDELVEGLTETKCGEGEVALCSTAPTQSAASLWLLALGFAIAFRSRAKRSR